ncbi:hypothetical protein ACFYOF_16700 [Streptomyces sp. NPDC007148]|uniref:hypothetical protein n=1 Tax=Streptomyces sp. NPDC007148 TaxID=3364775 RepID=UPI00368E5CC7
MTCEPPRSKHPLYSLWKTMVRRCHAPTAHAYERYGGRGIHVCPQWRKSFEQFLADVPPRPSPAHSLERIDNQRGYEPGNVRWATAAEQARNRRDNRHLTANGETRLLEDWATLTGLPKSTLFGRLKAGWDVERAITTPVRSKAPSRRRTP